MNINRKSLKVTQIKWQINNLDFTVTKQKYFFIGKKQMTQYNVYV